MILYNKSRINEHGLGPIYLCDILGCEEDAHAQNVNTGRLLCKGHYNGLGEVAQQRNWVLVQQQSLKKRERNKRSKCTKCGKLRVIEFVCLFGMDDAGPDVRVKKRELCKECTTSKNKCHHQICLDNYQEGIRQHKEDRR